MGDKGFYMLAGTVLTNLNVNDLQELMNNQRLPAEIKKGELKAKFKQQGKVFFRPGFDHEFILVGHAREHEQLMFVVNSICSVLKLHEIQHAYEIYDRDNNQIEEVDYSPGSA